MKSTSKINLNTKWQFNVLIAIASILVAIGGYFIYSYQANKIMQSKEKTLIAITTLESKQLSDWFLDELNDIQIITSYPYLIGEVKKTLKLNALADKSKLTKFLSQIQIEHNYKDVVIVSADGKSEIWSNEQPGVLNNVELRTIEKAFIQKKTLNTDLFRHVSNGEEKIFISFISVIKDADNNVLAALINRVDASLSVYHIIGKWPIPSETAESFLFKVENDSILFLNNLKYANNAALNLQIPIDNTELLSSQAVSGKLGLVSGTDYRNENVTGFVSKIEGTPWYLISKIDDSEMYQEKYVIAGVIAGFVLLLIFIIIFFIGFIYKRKQKNILMELYIKEKEVWQQQERFKVTMDSLGEGVIVTDMDARVQYINKNAEELTGWKYSDALGRNLGEVYPLKNEETGEKVNNILEKVIKQGVVKELANHTLLVLKNGKEIPIMDTGAPIFDDNGSLSGIVITFQDETEKRAQNRLIVESEQNLREFFENDITGDYYATAYGEILRCNSAFARILGYNSPDELVGRNILEFYRNQVDREEFLKIIQASKILKEFEVILNHKEGSEIFCILNIVGSYDESGYLVRYFGFLQDITKQKLAEEHIKLLSCAVDESSISIVITDAAGKINYVNPFFTEFTGYSPEEVLGKSHRILNSGKHPKAFYVNLWNTILSGKVWKGEIQNKKKNGELYWETVVISPILISNKEITHFVVIRKDITEMINIIKELGEAKEKAEESDQLKTAFINNISHEIRTPLNGILGFGQLLSESGISDEERIEYFNHVEKSSNRLIDTVTDYMDIALLVSNTMKVNKKEFALDPVFETIIEKIKPLCLANNIKFEVEMPFESNSVIINSDPVFIKKILDKLLNNALKFTKEGSISCGYKINTEQLECFVKDTGSGIEKDKQNFIFEMFRQEDSSMTRGYEGSGLGLAIASGLVTLLGGQIYVSSEKGKGSEFKFTIPFKNSNKSILHDKIELTKPKSTETPLILIAEDDELNFLFLEAVLDSLGYNYIHAVNGKEAVDFCRINTEISIVLMDIKMPVMNGDEATRQIREFRPDIPIIATTAYAITGDEYSFLEIGFDDYLPKPIIKEKLLAIIRKYVE